MSASWMNIPLEMREYNQWAVCTSDKIPRNAIGTPINVTQPNQFLPFDTAASVAYSKGWGIGFIITADDPYSCIDLDVKDADNCDNPDQWATQSTHDLHWRIIKSFESYTERSRSGKGYHIWVRGKVTSMRRDTAEIYSNSRFIIMTGNIVNQNPIENRQDILEGMASQMRDADIGKDFELEELPPTESNDAIIHRLMNCSNKNKFCALASGQWQSLNYPSQSEADLALISLISFFTKSNAQVREIFRLTELGKRQKAQKNDVYLNRSLRQVRARQKADEEHIQSVDFSDLIDSANSIQSYPHQIHATPFDVAPPLSASVAQSAPILEAVKGAPTEGLEWPPGLAGRIAQFMYSAAPRPVKEVAIVSTLGMLAGICGKAYSLPLSGLNLYIILVARSAIGKEAMHSSISTLASAISESCPFVNNFLSFTDFVSGPALLKEVIQNPSVCNISGEWGQKLLQIAKGEEGIGPLASLRKEMTNLYQKSGANSIVGGLAYSDKDKNIASVTGVAYSMIGETTPETFYSAVTPSMMADGFMSRFLTVEYAGERPPLNKNQVVKPDQALTDTMADIVVKAYTAISESVTIPVTRSPDAGKLLDEFEIECDANINKTDDEARRQLWNRAALKVLRVSALLAVADNWNMPVMRKAHVDWAISLVRHGIYMMESRIDTGDVGMGDNSRERKIIALLKEYIHVRPSEGYHISDDVYKSRIITRLYIAQRLGKHSAFENHRLGFGKSLNLTLDHLIENGVLSEIDKMTLNDKLNVKGRAFRILNVY